MSYNVIGINKTTGAKFDVPLTIGQSTLYGAIRIMKDYQNRFGPGIVFSIEPAY